MGMALMAIFRRNQYLVARHPPNLLDTRLALPNDEMWNTANL